MSFLSRLFFSNLAKITEYFKTATVRYFIFHQQQTGKEEQKRKRG